MAPDHFKLESQAQNFNWRTIVGRFQYFQAETPDNLRAFELASFEAEGLTEAFSKVSFSVDHGGSRSLMRKPWGIIYIYMYIIYSTEILKSTTCAYNYSI